MKWNKGEPPKGPCAGDWTDYLCIDAYGSYRLGSWIGKDVEKMVMFDGELSFTSLYWMELPAKPDDCEV